ncbi:HAMP domain-containing protein [bacterium]|nr:HAMP domain-containing protein [bacterium]
MKKTSIFRERSFIICWIGLFLSGALVLLLAGLLEGRRAPVRRTPAPPPVSLKQRAEEISRNITLHWTDPRLQQLTALGAALDSSGGNDESMIKRWLDRRRDIFSAVVWYRNRDNPLRVLRSTVPEELAAHGITGMPQARIIQFVYSGPLDRPAGATELYARRQLSGAGTEAPIVSLGIFLPDSRTRQALELFLSLDSLSLLTGSLEKKGESIAIVDTAGFLLAGSPPSGSAVSLKNKAELTDGRIRAARLELPNLPWSVIITVPVESAAAGSGGPTGGGRIRWPGPLHLVLLLLVSGLFARFLSPRLDRPVRALIDTASEIARGNFDEMIPESKDRELNRLVKVFNYMSSEMVRFREIDVHGIVNRKNKVETILKNIADGIIVTDSDDCVLMLNPVTEKWFAVQEPASIDKPLKDILKIPELTRLVKSVRKGSTVNHAEFQFNVAGFRKPKVFLAHAANVISDEGLASGVVTIIRDITKEKEADTIKTELISMVAHELKSPLTSIYGFSELLLDSHVLEDQAKEYAQVILNESSRLTELVNKFLDLSRLEAGKTEINMLPFDMKQLVEKITLFHNGMAKQKNIKVITEIPEKLPLASGDQDFIEQVILNLFSNAVKYSPVNSKIGIELKVEENRIQVSIIDNGYGIPKESLPYIFNKFYRVAESEESDQATEGSGLGLALAREIVEQHGGTIRVNSKLGVGSVFSFSIPVATIA